SVARLEQDAAALARAALRIATIVHTEGTRWPVCLLSREDRLAVLEVVDAPELVAALEEAFAVIPVLLSSRPALVELSQRELMVLRALATTTSRTAIAERLEVSVNTVKTQLRSLYQKLGVSDRESALERAREYGLVEL